MYLEILSLKICFEKYVKSKREKQKNNKRSNVYLPLS